MRGKKLFLDSRGSPLVHMGTKRDYLPAHVSPLWFIFTLAASLVLNVFMKHAVWFPDLAALTLILWTMRQPAWCGMTIAFVCGILVDVQQGSILGQHALAYVLLSYGVVKSRHRLAWYKPLGQALRLAPLLLSSQALVLVIRSACTRTAPDWHWLIGGLAAALIWPVWSRLLSLPWERGGGDLS